MTMPASLRQRSPAHFYIGNVRQTRMPAVRAHGDTADIIYLICIKHSA